MPTVAHNRHSQLRQPGWTSAANFAEAVLPLSGMVSRSDKVGMAMFSDGMSGIDGASKPGRARFGRDDP
jgi:hypothetical protein